MKTDLMDLEIKRCLSLARQFYDDIFAFSKVESLNEAKYIFTSMMVEQIVSMQQNHEIKSRKNLLVDVNTKKATLENTLMDAKT